MILDIPQSIYDTKIAGNKTTLALYMRGERSFCHYGVRWVGSATTGNKLRQLIGL